jgi:hypothetical protein
MVQKILDAHPHPEMGYRSCLGIIRLNRSCLGIIRLGQRYPAARVEAAAQRALLTGAVSYKSLESILRHCLDQQPSVDERGCLRRSAAQSERQASRAVDG